jgi:WD40 repeat protein
MRLFGVCVGLTLLWAVGAAQNVVKRSTYLGQGRFSPDGHYILAQDDAVIVVLTTQPLAILFRIPAVKAAPAQLAPDSSEIAFLSSITRVSPPVSEPEKLTPHLEWWSVAGKNRVGFFDAPAAGCGTLVLSSDGRVLACDDIQGTLKLFDVPACKVLYEKRQFVRLFDISRPDEFPRQYVGELGEAGIEFSPDGRFLSASSEGGDSLLWDLRENVALKPPGELRGRPRRAVFPQEVFVSTNRIILLAGFSHKLRIAKLVSFPEGHVLSTHKIPMGHLLSTTDPGFVLIRPLPPQHLFLAIDPSINILPHTHHLILRDDLFDQRSTAVELSTGHLIESKQSLMDVFGPYYVAQPSPGEVGLYDRGKGLQATISLKAD